MLHINVYSKITKYALFSFLIFVNYNHLKSEVSDPLVCTLHKLSLKHLESQRQIQVWANDQHITTYHYNDTLEKPFLYPVNTLSGKRISRGYPYDPQPGERVDHPHHAGIWMNYGNVNGLDYWNNSFAKRGASKGKYGVIRHREIVSMESEGSTATLRVKLDWLDSEGATLLEEDATFIIRYEESLCAISRHSTLKALSKEVRFTDNKEGFFAIRVAKELEHPSKKPYKALDSTGKKVEESALNNTNVTGEYLSSEGISGTKVWGTRAKWMQLAGFIQGDPVQVIILDHPDNPGYPTYWHARGYGLFSANPLGQKIFSHDKEVLDFHLLPGQSHDFKYQILIQEGTPIGTDEIEQAYEAFSRQ